MALPPADQPRPTAALTWGGDAVWTLEDRLGHRTEVLVEPRLVDLFDVGAQLVIDDERFVLVARRGAWVQLDQ